MRNIIEANTIFFTQDVHVSEKMVPFHLRQIQPLEGSNCIMIGLRGLVLTLSSIKSSSKLTVEACSMIDSGVVSTIGKAVADEEACAKYSSCRRRRSNCNWLAVPEKRGDKTVVHPPFLVDGTEPRECGDWLTREMHGNRARHEFLCCSIKSTKKRIRGVECLVMKRLDFTGPVRS